MNSGDLDQEVSGFILNHVDSVEQLEILIMLRESAPRIWTIEEICHSLHSTKSSVELRVKGLCAKGFLECSATAAGYKKQSNESERIIQNVIDTYKHKKTRTIELIFSKPHPNLIGFANAFKLRKDK
jgi:hypothetical protein